MANKETKPLEETVFEFGVEYPVEWWNRPLKADFKQFFKSLTKAAIAGVTTDWKGLTKDVVDVVGAIGLHTPVEQRAWVLIRRSLATAILELFKASPPYGSALPENDDICERLDISIEKAKLKIDRAFFDNPGTLPIVDHLRMPLEQWLVAFGHTAASAKSMSGRLRTYFVYALHTEWRKDSDLFVPIHEKLKSPFFDAAQRERGWVSYLARLCRLADEPVFDEPFGLRDIYVPLRCYRVERGKKSEETRKQRMAADVGASGDDKRIVLDVKEAVKGWVGEWSKEDVLRVISGGPGSGKSSFVKMLVAELAAEGDVRPLLIPLHLFPIADSVAAGVEHFVREQGELTENPLDSAASTQRLLLVFDGLDEIGQLGRAGLEAVDSFVREVERTLTLKNGNGCRVMALLAGREPAVQAAAGQLRETQRVLHLLPYFVSEEEKGKYDTSRVKLDDQRGAWWTKYGSLRGRAGKGLPAELDRDDLSSITEQPLLNYLLALSYDRKKIDFSEDVNLNEIYADLLEAVFDRRPPAEASKPAAKSAKHRVTEQLSFDEFRCVFQEVAVATWHGNGRTASAKEIEARCKEGPLAAALKKVSEEGTKGAAKLMLAFFTREAGRGAGGEGVYEFTHKSFREYLTACRIVEEAVGIAEDVRGRGGRRWVSDEELLARWARLCGTTAIDLDLLPFVQREVALRAKAEPELAANIQRAYCGLIETMLRDGMPMHALALKTFGEMNRQARNAEEALLVALCSAAFITKKRSEIKWPTEGVGHDFGPSADGGCAVVGAWLHRLCKQKRDEYATLKSLGWLNLRQIDLQYQDLSNANLCGTVLSGASLFGASLSGTILSNADLSSTHLFGALFFRADLSGTNLSESLLSDADFSEANLSSANLNGAILPSANFARANLSSTNLSEALLSEANFSEANLSEANLSDANLSNALVSREELKKAGGKWKGTPRYVEDEAATPVVKVKQKSGKSGKSKAT